MSDRSARFKATLKAAAHMHTALQLIYQEEANYSNDFLKVLRAEDMNRRC